MCCQQAVFDTLRHQWNADLSLDWSLILPGFMGAERGGRNGRRLRTIWSSLSSDICHLIFHLIPLGFTFCHTFFLLFLLGCHIQFLHLGDALWTRADEQVVLPVKKAPTLFAPLIRAFLITTILHFAVKKIFLSGFCAQKQPSVQHCNYTSGPQHRPVMKRHLLEI